MTLRKRIDQIKLRYPHLFSPTQNRTEFGQDFAWAISELERNQEWFCAECGDQIEQIAKCIPWNSPQASGPCGENWK